MDGEHCHAHSRDVRDAGGDGVVNVEELHVEEDLLAPSGKFAGEIEAACESQLVADLVEGNDAVQVLDHRLGLAKRRHVQPDDKPVPHGRHGSIRVENIMARSIRVLHTFSI